MSPEEIATVLAGELSLWRDVLVKLTAKVSEEPGHGVTDSIAVKKYLARPRGMSEADWLTARLTGQEVRSPAPPDAEALREVVKGVVQDIQTSDASDQLLNLFAAKQAQAVESARQDIIRTGDALADELLEAQQQGDSDFILISRGYDWCSRCLTWANEDAGLTREQRAAFQDAPAAPTTLKAMRQTIEANLSAIRNTESEA
jgi:hypothetical protein